MTDSAAFVIAFARSLRIDAELCGMTPEATETRIREFHQLLDVVRADCFRNSPLTQWLMGDAGHRFTLAEYDEDAKLIRCNLDDVADDGDDPVATGYGETLEAAQADALNRLMGGRQ